MVTASRERTFSGPRAREPAGWARALGSSRAREEVSSPARRPFLPPLLPLACAAARAVPAAARERLTREGADRAASCSVDIRCCRRSPELTGAVN